MPDNQTASPLGQTVGGKTITAQKTTIQNGREVTVYYSGTTPVATNQSPSGGTTFAPAKEGKTLSEVYGIPQEAQVNVATPQGVQVQTAAPTPTSQAQPTPQGAQLQEPTVETTRFTDATGREMGSIEVIQRAAEQTREIREKQIAEQERQLTAVPTPFFGFKYSTSDKTLTGYGKTFDLSKVYILPSAKVGLTQPLAEEQFKQRMAPKVALEAAYTAGTMALLAGPALQAIGGATSAVAFSATASATAKGVATFGQVGVFVAEAAGASYAGWTVGKAATLTGLKVVGKRVDTLELAQSVGEATGLALGIPLSKMFTPESSLAKAETVRVSEYQRGPTEIVKGAIIEGEPRLIVRGTKLIAEEPGGFQARGAAKQTIVTKYSYESAETLAKDLGIDYLAPTTQRTVITRGSFIGEKTVDILPETGKFLTLESIKPTEVFNIEGSFFQTELGSGTAKQIKTSGQVGTILEPQPLQRLSTTRYSVTRAGREFGVTEAIAPFETQLMGKPGQVLRSSSISTRDLLASARTPEIEGPTSLIAAKRTIQIIPETETAFPFLLEKSAVIRRGDIFQLRAEGTGASLISSSERGLPFGTKERFTVLSRAGQKLEGDFSMRWLSEGKAKQITGGFGERASEDFRFVRTPISQEKSYKMPEYKGVSETRTEVPQISEGTIQVQKMAPQERTTLRTTSAQQQHKLFPGQSLTVPEYAPLGTIRGNLPTPQQIQIMRPVAFQVPPAFKSDLKVFSESTFKGLTASPLPTAKEKEALVYSPEEEADILTGVSVVFPLDSKTGTPSYPETIKMPGALQPPGPPLPGFGTGFPTMIQPPPFKPGLPAFSFSLLPGKPTPSERPKITAPKYTSTLIGVLFGKPIKKESKAAFTGVEIRSPVASKKQNFLTRSVFGKGGLFG